jgi:NAD(P)H dehydrogenase (quinone)
VIVVTGAGGNVGRLVARELARRGAPFRAVTRNVERLPDLGGAEIALAGYDEPDTLLDALEPGDRVFMVSMHEPPERRIPLHRGFIDGAARRGVARIVYLSFVGAGPDATFLHARSHGETENDLTCVTITVVESVTLAELAAIAWEVTGDSYRYEPLGPDLAGG